MSSLVGLISVWTWWAHGHTGPDNARTLRGTGVRVFGGIDDVPRLLRQLDADTVIITGFANLSAQKSRRLGWDFDPAQVHVMLGARIIDVAGPRIHLRLVDGLSLVEVATPRFDGPKLILKRGFDLPCVAAVALVSIPVGLVVALCIKVDDGGPIYFRQSRVGLLGEEFGMLEFRSMRTDAEQVLEKLRAEQESQDARNEVIVKMKDDQRATRVGRVIRALSIDELLQLINVLWGR